MSKQNRFMQHLPTYFDFNIERFVFDFDTTDELLSHPKIAYWKQHKKFHKFSKSKDGPNNVLMVELNKGYTWYVLGFIASSELINLPEWKPKYKLNEKVKKYLERWKIKLILMKRR